MKRDLKSELFADPTKDSTSTPAHPVPWPDPTAVEVVRDGRKIVTFSSWNLLGLYGHRDVGRAVRSASSVGVGIAQGLGGRSHEQIRLESRACSLFGGARAQVFSSRQQAVLSVITALCGEGSVIVGMPGTVLPLADAALLAGAEFVEAKDGELRVTLGRLGPRSRVLVWVEAVSVLLGERRDVVSDLAVCEEYGAWLCIDESGALGTVGPRGAGSAEDLPWHPALLARVSALALVPGVNLGVLVGGDALLEHLASRSWHLQVETGASPVLSAAGVAALDLLELSVQARKQIEALSKLVRESLLLNGWQVSSSGSCPYLVVRMGTLREARALQHALGQRDLLVEALPLRGYRRTDAVVRVLISSLHSDYHIGRLLEALDVFRNRAGLPSSS